MLLANFFSTQEQEQLEIQKSQIGGDLDELKIVNSELKKRDEERRAHERELKLYHRWRAEQPLLREVRL